MLIGERMPLELVQRLQRSGLFERIHSAAASPERVAASLEHNCTEQSRVNRADTLAKVYLMALTLGATAPLTPFKEEREFSMTVNVHRGNELLKAYSASATVVLKHRGGPDEQKVAKARQAIHEQLWSGLVGQMVADREFLASALVASKQQPIGELSP